MKPFNERLSTTPKVENIGNVNIGAFISQEAYAKMMLFVDECSDEVGWLGTATREGDYIMIHEVFLFDQQVHGATTEISPEGLAEFGEELLQREDGVETWNNLRMWGHSHVNMGVSPSGQDDKQMKEFGEGGSDWFVRLIANKKGDLCIDLYDYKIGVAFKNIPWVRVKSDRERELDQQMKDLQETLNTLKKDYDSEVTGNSDEYKDEVKAEMKEKVKKFRTTTPNRHYGYGAYGTYGNYPHNDYQGGQKKTQTNMTQQNMWEDIEDVILEPEDLLLFFTIDDVEEIGLQKHLAHAQSFIENDCGYKGATFTDNDIKEIYKYATQFVTGGLTL